MEDKEREDKEISALTKEIELKEKKEDYIRKITIEMNKLNIFDERCFEMLSFIYTLLTFKMRFHQNTFEKKED